MRWKSVHMPEFPVTCARCGGQVTERVSFCPHCGTHARFAFASAKPTAVRQTRDRGRPLADPRWPARPTPLFPAGQRKLFADVSAPASDSARHWGVKTGTGLALATFVLLYGVVVLHRQHDAVTPQPTRSNMRIAAGSVQSGRVQPDSVPSTAQPSTAQQNSADSGRAPSKVDKRGFTARSAEPEPDRTLSAAVPRPIPSPDHSESLSFPGRRPASGPTDSAARPPATANSSLPQAKRVVQDARPSDAARASISGPLAVVRDNLAKDNLPAARRALAPVLSAQPANREAFMLQQDLLSRERERDAKLSQARICAMQQRWNCAWQHAGSALAVDSGSVEAKAIVQRSMIESGAAFKPAGPGPDTVEVPMNTH